TYLKGVVAAEMPARYHMEALKAQAVAARTYTLKQLPAYGGRGSKNHPEADISTDFRYNQAWLSEEEMKEKWGFLSFFYFWLRISRSVEETAGRVIVYENKIIDAVYHSNSGGRTEDASSVWGEKIPYLISVDSPYDKENERNYQHNLSFSIEEFDERLNTDIKLNTSINIESIPFEDNMDLIDNATLSKKIFSLLKEQPELFTIQGYEIIINNEPIAFIKEKESAEEALLTVKDTYVNDERFDNLLDVSFIDKVELKASYNNVNNITSDEESIDRLLSTEEEKQIYKVQKGDTLSQIANNNDLSLEELIQLNPKLKDKQYLQIGEEVNILIPKPLASVQTIEEKIYTETIPKSTVYRENDQKYKNHKKTLQEGKDGTKEVTSHITNVNGLEESKDIITEEIIEEPIDKIIEVGTKPLPVKRATGTFMYPVNGRLTSDFGNRWGGFHTGIDLAAPIGRSIKASDGGVVSFAGWSSNTGYGYLVKIDHQNGFKTYYAHNSKIYVKPGQKVAKGEVIAAIGSTGKSTGPHLHFEIRKNGRPQNPYNYIR
ncbi:MAG: SpoIID/LytB domain-containing protein, partial [bacterium]